MKKRENEDEILDETHIRWVSEIIAKVVYYNITGEGEEPSEFERRLAQKETDKMLEAYSK